MKNRFTLITLAVAIAVALTGCAGDAKDKAEAAPPKADPIPVKSGSVKSEKMSSDVELSGVLIARNEAYVTAKAGGEIIRLSKDVGGKVSKGEVLVQLDSAAYKLQRDRDSLAIQTAEANHANLKDQHARIKALYESGSVPKSELDALDTQLKVSELGLKSLKVSYDSSNLNLGYTTVKSPITGTIAERKVSYGENVGVGQTLFHVVDTGALFVETGVSENVIGMIKPGDAVVFSAQGKEYKGTVESISPVMNKDTKAYPVRITVGNEDGNLRVGMTVTSKIKLGQMKDALAVPKSAVLINDDKTFVMVIEGEKVTKREVALGASNDASYEVVSGVKAGENIVVSNPGILKGGEVVKIVQ